MSYKFCTKCFSALRMVLAILVFCWFTLAGTGLAGDEHDHQQTHVDSGQHTESDQQTAHDEHEGHDEHEEFVRLSKAEMQEFGIHTALAGPGTLHIEFTVPGEVAVNYDRLAHIAPRFPGVVKQVNKHLGDEVKKGDVLAIIESNEALVPYEVRSLLDGTVIEKHITIGEVHSEESPAFVIADLSDVWVNLSIYQMHLPYVRVGQKVVISAGQEFPDATGRISYLSPIVDEHTRTATARVVLDNTDRRWRPGLFVEGKISADKIGVALLVPKSALQNMEGRTVVFVESEESFVPQPVRVGRTNSNSVEIISGLSPGQRYVNKGAFTLKAELQKSALRGGHGH